MMKWLGLKKNFIWYDGRKGNMKVGAVATETYFATIVCTKSAQKVHSGSTKVDFIFICGGGPGDIDFTHR